jgi:hypothetical protein
MTRTNFYLIIAATIVVWTVIIGAIMLAFQLSYET